MSVTIDPIQYTDEQLDELSIITDEDLQIAHRQITTLLDPAYKNILLTLEDGIDNAFTNEPKARPATA